MRVELSESRSTFLELREQGGTRLRSLKAQLEALGPEPAEDEVESIEISDRRTALKQQIKLEEAPSREAAEAFARANGLIAEVDEIIRARQAAKLFELRKSPLNPSLLVQSTKELGAFITSVRDETVAAKTLVSQNILQIFIWVFIAGLLIWQGNIRIKQIL